MLDGITILNQSEIMKYSQLQESIAFWLFIVGIGLIILGVIIEFKNELIGTITLIFGAIMVLAVLFNPISPSTPTGRYEYDVLIDNSVSYIEFINNYSVLETDGNIYTIVIKKNHQ